MAEDVRERAGLDYIALFRHDAKSHMPLEELARASLLSVDDMTRVRSAGHAAVRGMRRFARRAVTLEGGVFVVAAETAGREVVSVVASGAAGGRLAADVNSALVDLAQAAAALPAETPSPRHAPASRPLAYGARFGEALAFLERPPILGETRRRLLRAVDQRHAAVGDVIEIVETDAGLAAAVVSRANRLKNRPRNGFASVPAAISAIGPRGALRLASELPTLRPSAPGSRMGAVLLKVSAHAIVTRSAVDLVARAIGERRRDELRLVASLHDIGKVALAGLIDDGGAIASDAAAAPEERVAAERARLTIDHAAIGALALRRLGLPQSVTAVVDRHHAEDTNGHAAMVRLADMLAHLSVGDAVRPQALAAVAQRLSLDEATLDAIAYDLPRAPGARAVTDGQSPLTPMQQKALRGLADGKLYKQIAAELGLSQSTVRSHVHNLYRKLDVADRAQAVLLASERGWI